MEEAVTTKNVVNEILHGEVMQPKEIEEEVYEEEI